MRRPPYALIGLGIALALVAVLAWQNRSLRADQAWLIERATEPYYGMYVPIVPVADVQGRALALGGVTGDFQVLYFFTTQCACCRESAPMVRTLAGRIAAESRGRVQMIGVGQAPAAAVRNYAREHGFEFPVAAVEDRRTLMLFRGRTVPLVMVIGADGRVRHWHFGALDTREQVDAILAAMRRTDAPAVVTTQTSLQAPDKRTRECQKASVGRYFCMAHSTSWGMTTTTA